MPARSAGPHGRRRLGWLRRVLNLLVVLALGPSILMAVAAAGVWAGLMDWGAGFAAFAAGASPRLALATVATGVVALLAALFADFDRMWLRALLAISISAATIGGYIWTRSVPPQDASSAGSRAGEDPS